MSTGADIAGQAPDIFLKGPTFRPPELSPTSYEGEKPTGVLIDKVADQNGGPAVATSAADDMVIPPPTHGPQDLDLPLDELQGNELLAVDKLFRHLRRLVLAVNIFDMLSLPADILQSFLNPGDTAEGQIKIIACNVAFKSMKLIVLFLAICIGALLERWDFITRREIRMPHDNRQRANHYI